VNPSLEAAGKTSLFCALRNPTCRSGTAHKASPHVTYAGSGKEYGDAFTSERLDSPFQRHRQTHAKPLLVRQHRAASAASVLPSFNVMSFSTNTTIRPSPDRHYRSVNRQKCIR
jgi:hypothetical protein